MTDNTIFTEEEMTDLAETQRVRKTLIQILTMNGVPESGTKQVLLLGLLDGSDRSSFSKAKLRTDKSRDDHDRDTVKLVRETLRSINIRTYRPPANDKEREIPKELEHRTFVPGELEIGIEPIPPEHLMDE